MSVTVPIDGKPQRLLPALLAAARGISRAMGSPEHLDPTQVVRTRGR
jgi:hypothetical protein